MKQDQFTWNWYSWLLVSHSQWTTLEPLYYSSFVFATLVHGVIGINFVDHFLNQGAPAEHKSAETPIGHESKYIYIFYGGIAYWKCLNICAIKLMVTSLHFIIHSRT